MYTAACKNLMLDAFGITHISLHTAYSASGANEVTGGSPAYARKAISFSAAGSGSNAGTITTGRSNTLAGTVAGLGADTYGTTALVTTACAGIGSGAGSSASVHRGTLASTGSAIGLAAGSEISNRFNAATGTVIGAGTTADTTARANNASGAGTGNVVSILRKVTEYGQAGTGAGLGVAAATRDATTEAPHGSRADPFQRDSSIRPGDAQQSRPSQFNTARPADGRSSRGRR